MGRRSRRREVENIFTGTILVEEKPLVVRRGNLVHFIGAQTGIRLAVSEDMFMALTGDAGEVAAEIAAERKVIQLRLSKNPFIIVRGEEI